MTEPPVMSGYNWILETMYDFEMEFQSRFGDWVAKIIEEQNFCVRKAVQWKGL